MYERHAHLLMKQRAGVTANRTVSHANVRHGHKQYKDKFFHCLTYWTICQRGKSTAGGQYNLTEKKWQRAYWRRTTDWKETIFCLGLKVTWQRWSKVIKWIHTEKYAPPTTYDNFYDKCFKAKNHTEPQETYGLCWSRDRMMNNYSTQHWIWKWPKEVLFLFSDMTILNSCLLLTAYGTKMIHKTYDFLSRGTWFK